jgi:hypothetical protein
MSRESLATNLCSKLLLPRLKMWLYVICIKEVLFRMLIVTLFKIGWRRKYNSFVLYLQLYFYLKRDHKNKKPSPCCGKSMELISLM